MLFKPLRRCHNEVRGVAVKLAHLNRAVSTQLDCREQAPAHGRSCDVEKALVVEAALQRFSLSVAHVLVLSL